MQVKERDRSRVGRRADRFDLIAGLFVVGVVIFLAIELWFGGAHFFASG